MRYENQRKYIVSCWCGEMNFFTAEIRYSAFSTANVQRPQILAKFGYLPNRGLRYCVPQWDTATEGGFSIGIGNGTIPRMWSWRRKPTGEGFPNGFRVQRVGVTAAKAISDLPASQIAKHFREHPEIAIALLNESYDRRFTPSTFLAEEGEGFWVGWFTTRDVKYECIQRFSDLADAATDYLLFSLGKGRWKPPTDDGATEKSK